MRLVSEALAVFALVPGLLGGFTTAADTSAYAVVVAEDVPLTDISLEELRRVFLLKRMFWKPGKVVRLVLPSAGQPARAFLLEHVCQKTEGQLRRLVLEATYRGEADQPPKVAGSEDDALKLVSSLRGSVALVSAEAVLPPGAKRLRVDGKLPGDAGYALGN